MKSRSVLPFAAGTFVALLLAFFAFELTPGVRSDTTDWSMYVTHARNISSGHPYSETKYVFQPESTTEVGGNAYPPGLPLMLAPLIAFTGIDIHLFKLLNCSFLALSLWPIYLFARRTLSPPASLLIIAILGFSTLFMANFDAIGSDAPYEFFSFWLLVFLLWIYDKGLNETKPWPYGLAAGLFIAFAYMVRPFGIAFFLSIALFDLVRKRRITPFTIACASSLVPILFLSNRFFHADGGYNNQFTFSPAVVAHHALDYIRLFSVLFASPVSNRYRYALWALALIPLAIGFFNRVRNGPGLTEIYLLIVLAVDCVYWVPNGRYLLPVVPILLVYVVEGFQLLLERAPVRFRLPLKALCAALFLFPAAANAFLVRPNASDTLVKSANFDGLCAALRSQPADRGIVLFWNPRVLALSTDRLSSGWPADQGTPGLLRYFNRLHPAYVIVDNQDPDDRNALIPALAADTANLAPIYENPRFRLLRFLPERDKP